MLLTDLLFNSPRMKFSRAQQQAILSWGKQLGAQDVPSLKQLSSAQKDLLAKTGDPTSHQRSSKGNVFYLNEIGDSIAKVRARQSVHFI